MGRKKIEIDWDKVDEKLSHFCEGTEIAEHLGISYATLERRVREKFNVDFVEYKRQKRAKGEMILRELQLKSAKEGNTAMLIWLGKQYLKQTDKTDQQIKHEITHSDISDDELISRINKLFKSGSKG